MNLQKLSMIDSAFADLMMDHDEAKAFSIISSVLSALTSIKSFKISIVDCDQMKKDPFFGMRCLPDKESASGAIREMISKDLSFNDLVNKWRTIKYWEIEIDSRVFDRSIINFNPQELTAMILHEVGHVTYSDRPIEGFYRAFKEAFIRSKIEDKARYRALYTLYLIPLFVACGFRNWNLNEYCLKEEIFADNSVKRLGYGDHLVSAYQKIIRHFGNTNVHNSSKKELNEISASIEFCNQNIADLEKRQYHLKDELYYIGIRNKGFWIRNVISSLMKDLGIIRKDKYYGNIVTEALSYEAFDDKDFLHSNQLILDLKGSIAIETMIRKAVDVSKMYKIAQEGMFRKKKSKIPSQLDIDTLYVEVDRIQNHADRRYALDLVYTQEEKILEFLELFKNNEPLMAKYKVKCESMLRQLADIRRQILNKRSFDSQYKVFVKYPVGYEG